MISRIWHGYTTRANADAYESLLKEEIFAGILSRFDERSQHYEVRERLAN